MTIQALANLTIFDYLFLTELTSSVVKISMTSLHSLRLIKDISQVALPTVLPIMHRSHEDAGTTVLGRTFPPQPLDLPIPVDLVVLEHGQLALLALMLDLLGRRVDLLLALLGAAAETQDEVQGRFFLDVVVAQGAAVFELFAGEDEALLVRGDAFFVYWGC